MGHGPGRTRWRGFARLAAVAACGLLVAVASARTPKPPLCTSGRFIVPATDPPLFAAPTLPAQVELLAARRPQVLTRDRCPAVRVRLRATRRGTTLLATWTAGACGVPGKVRLKGTIVDLCQTLTGTLKIPKSRPAELVAPRCGDGVV